jgi:glutamate 5-kinase
MPFKSGPRQRYQSFADILGDTANAAQIARTKSEWAERVIMQAGLTNQPVLSMRWGHKQLIAAVAQSLDTRRFICYELLVRSDLLKKTDRIVVKLGTGVLTDSRKQPDLSQMEQLVGQVAAQCRAGKEIVLVSSGAVGSGMGALGYKKRPGQLAELQACAAVGQSRLMATYDKLFSKHDLHVAQVLLTHEDLQDHERHLNARNTLVTLLSHGVVPIINENDAVSSTELKFGDNDKLSALVASLLPADLLVILTTVDGVIENFGKANARTVPTIEQIDSELESIVGGTDSETAVGGMASKVQAAKIVMRSGIPLVIASGHKEDVLACVVEGADEGTIFIPQPTRLQGRKRWIAFFHHPKGTLFVDEGAKTALRENGKSLLPPGVKGCEGEFDAGDVLRICDLEGTEFARGICNLSAEEIHTRAWKRSEVVHRDNLVIL